MPSDPTCRGAAFRRVSFRRDLQLHSDYLQDAKDCAADTGKSNDLIPIIVGCVLAAMVVIVLVAYLIGRRYQANNYERMEE